MDSSASKNVILDTDWFTDVDDVMAVRALIRLHQRGILHLLGACINAVYPQSARSLDAFLQAHGVDVPVAITRDDLGVKTPGPSYQKFLAALPSKYESNDATETPVRLYRRLLAASETPVEILSIGFANNLAALLESPADDLSPLTGVELVRQKACHLWMMAGAWPEGREYNLSCGDDMNPYIAKVGSLVLEKWSVPITFLGFEVGFPLLSGGNLPEDDLLRRAMVAYQQTPGYNLGGAYENQSWQGKPKAHFSWDPMLVLLAGGVLSPNNGRFLTVRGHASFDPITAQNSFVQNPKGPHEYVVKNHTDQEYGQWIDEWLA